MILTPSHTTGLRGSGRRRWAMALFAAALGACDGGVGCGGCADIGAYPDPAPPGGELLVDGLAINIQERAVEFVAAHLGDLLRASNETRITQSGDERVIFEIGETTISGTSVRIRDGCIGDVEPSVCPAADSTFLSTMELSLATIDDAVSARYLFGANQGVRVTLHDIDVFADIAYAFDLPIGDAACRISDASDTVPAIRLDSLAFDIAVSVDPQQALQLHVENVSVVLEAASDTTVPLNIEVSACNVPGSCDDPTCHDGLLDFECGISCGVSDLAGEVGELVAEFFTPLIEDMAASLVHDALSDILATYDNQPLDVHSRWRADELLGAPPPLWRSGEFATQWVFGAQANDSSFAVSGPSTGRGMQVVFDAGSHAEASGCAPYTPPPWVNETTEGLPFFDGVVDIANSVDGSIHPEIYHFAVLASESVANRLAFALYQQGLLCLQLGPEELSRASGGSFVPTLATLAFFAPNLESIGDLRSELMLQVHPTAVPVVTLGPDPNLDEDGALSGSLVQVDLGEMGLSIYAHLDDSFVRLATIGCDVRIGLSLLRTPDNTLQLTLDEVAVDNVVSVYNEMADAADFAEIIDVLVTLAVEGITEQLPVLGLDIGPLVSAALGDAPLYARINEVRTEAVSETGEAYLTGYMTLCDEADRTNPDRSPCYSPEALGSSGPPPPPPHVSSARLNHNSGTAQIDVGVDREKQWQVKAPGRPWSAFASPEDGLIEVQSPLLRLTGSHVVQVRSRQRSQYWTLSPIHDVVLQSEP